MSAFSELAEKLKKPPSRLQDRETVKQLTRVSDREFRGEVWTRDKSRCRKCGRKVVKAMGRIAERGEVHHLHGRLGDLRFEAKAALLLCLECHEQVTGRIAEKWIAIGTKFWKLHGERVIDATAPVKFKRVA